MAVLRDDTDGSECRRRTQDSANIMRVRHLVEHEQDGPLGRLVEDVFKPDFFERLGFYNHALVRSIVRDEAAEVGDVGQRDGQLFGEWQRRRRFSRSPGADYLALRVVERGGHRMPTPEARTLRASVALMRFLAP